MPTCESGFPFFLHPAAPSAPTLPTELGAVVKTPPTHWAGAGAQGAHTAADDEPGPSEQVLITTLQLTGPPRPHLGKLSHGAVG